MKKVVCLLLSLSLVVLVGCNGSHNSKLTLEAIGYPDLTGDPYEEVIKKEYQHIIKLASKKQRDENGKTIQTDPFEEAEKHLKNNYYALYDIDRNGVNELLFRQVDTVGGVQQYDPDTVGNPSPFRDETIFIDRIFTVREGEIVEITPFWPNVMSTLERSVLSDGYIRCVDGNYTSSKRKYTYLKLENGVFTSSIQNKRPRPSTVEPDHAYIVSLRWRCLGDYGKGAHSGTIYTQKQTWY